MKKTALLRKYLYFFGIAKIASSFTIPLVLGDTILWQPRNLPTDLMVGSLYLAMGIGMVCIARTVEKHKGFIDFIVMANVFHAVIMIVFAQKPIHIYLDAGFIGLMGLLPLLVYPWGVANFLRHR